MYLQNSFHSVDGSITKRSKEEESPRFKIDSFEEELEKEKQNEEGGNLIYNFQKEGLKRILNSSSSNDRLMLPQMRNDESMEIEQQINYETENSMESDNMRRSFIKRQQSLSVLHSRRGQSSQSISDCKSIVQNLCSQIPQKKQHIICNCKKSKCLKLYCDCFHNKTFCGPQCGCYDCGNKANNHQHQQAIYQALSRNPNAFDEQFQKENSNKSQGIVQRFSLRVAPQTVKRGCKCRKTKCLKKYCECFNSGQKCGVFCKCQGCQNNDSQNGMQVQSFSQSIIKA